MREYVVPIKLVYDIGAEQVGHKTEFQRIIKNTKLKAMSQKQTGPTKIPWKE